LAQVVVLPLPCRPHIISTSGGCVGDRQAGGLAAEQLGQRVVEALDELLAGLDRVDDLLADHALAHVGDELLGDLEVDVGLEQRLAHGADAVVDVGLGERLLADDGAVGLAEGIGERIEHARRRMLPRLPPVKGNTRAPVRHRRG
jgi:hypothetical protein